MFPKVKIKLTSKEARNSENNKCRIYLLNLRGLASKQRSLNKIINNNDKTMQFQILLLNETALKMNQKPQIENFVGFSRNRKNQAMGGVATLVHEKYKDKCVRVTEGIDDDEYIITRHSNFSVPLNIINIYGEQEGRTSKKEIEERWSRVLQEIEIIEKRHEFLLLLGDMNKHISNDELGIEGNHDKLSFGGQLIRGLLANGKYLCINNSSKTVNGPFTRLDPSRPDDRDGMSALSLVFASVKLEPFIEEVFIDTSQEYSPISSLSKKKIVRSDHFPVIITLSAH